MRRPINFISARRQGFSTHNTLAPPSVMAASSRPVLSLILCSRNDEYMGNSLWRLRTALDYTARQVAKLGRGPDVEILVSDWGSEVPLREILELSPAAANIVSFIHVPPTLARELQKDSPFAEVLALNAAARRAKGEYIGRIDQDTLVGGRFLGTFFDLHAGKQSLAAPLGKSLLFANLRFIPYRFAVRCPPLEVVDWFVRTWGEGLEVTEPKPPIPFYAGPVGICLMHRSLWYESGGYDERMIYMNAMETNLARRLLMKYNAVNLGALDRHDFFHLEHYHPWAVRKTSTHRKVNPHLPFSEPDTFNPNGESWGLMEYTFDMRPSSLPPVPAVPPSNARREMMKFMPAFLSIKAQMTMDAGRAAEAKWARRATKARERIGSEPVRRWPHALRQLWLGRAAG